jgi:hypothetical protein
MKSILLFTAMIFVLFFGKNSNVMSAENKKINLYQKDDSLAIYYKRMELACEGRFNEIMIDKKHPNGRLAPEILRFFIEKFEPRRITFSQGVNEDNNGMLHFYWFINEFAVEGEVGKFFDEAKEFFIDQKYLLQQAPDSINGQKIFLFNSNNLIFKFTLENFSNYTGGPLCGGSVSLDITLETRLPETTIENILKLYSSINCYSLPSKILDQFKKQTFSNISYGGTWEQYYSWDVDVKCADEASLAELNKSVVSEMIKIGFKLYKNEDKLLSYELNNGDNSSYIYISREEQNILTFRYQPNS